MKGKILRVCVLFITGIITKISSQNQKHEFQPHFESLEKSEPALEHAEYIKHYNTSRLHGSLHYLTPEDYLLSRKDAHLKTRENDMIVAEELRARYLAAKQKAA